MVFEKNGRFGVKNGTGTVTIPPVYAELGWSDGTDQVLDDVIGFKRNGFWGLVSVKNKIRSANKFYSIAPIASGHFKASVKGKFSNELFYGLLDSSGEIIISFNYADLEINGHHLTASSFDQLEANFGLINLENEVLIPIKYETISDLGNFKIGRVRNQQNDVYHDFQLVAAGLDSLQLVNSGLVGFRDGKAGFIDSEGHLKHEFLFKKISFQPEATAISFPSWEVRDSAGMIFETNADSISRVDESWVLHFNGAQHFTFDQINQTEYALRGRSEDKLVVQHLKTRKWEVWDSNGVVLIANQDLIRSSGQFFLTKQGDKWSIYNSFGTKMNRFPLDEIANSETNFFTAKEAGYWGVIDFKGDSYITFKYDSIIAASAAYYAVKFLNKWGITDRHGNWKVNPEFDGIEVFQNLIVGRKAASYSYFNDGKFLFRSTFKIESSFEKFLLIENDISKKGLLQTDGSLFKYPLFDTIKLVEDYFVAINDGQASVFKRSGESIVGFEEGYEDFGTLKNGYIQAKRTGRWGFVDTNGRLRISNRYEEVKPFMEGLAAVKIRRRWGFIDESENLVIQPHYEKVSSFFGGVAIASSNDHFGLINRDGEEVVAIKWASVERTKMGNYVVTDINGLKGIVNAAGAFILRPNYDRVADHAEGIIVERDKKSGMLNYDGSQLYNLRYADIRLEGGYLLLAR